MWRRDVDFRKYRHFSLALDSTSVGFADRLVAAVQIAPRSVYGCRIGTVRRVTRFTSSQINRCSPKEVSDPAKVAQVVLRLAASDRLPAHLLIGSDAVRFDAEAEKTRGAEAAQWREVSLSTDVDSSTALPEMRF